jgi:hypothetical protein
MKYPSLAAPPPDPEPLFANSHFRVTVLRKAVVEGDSESITASRRSNVVASERGIVAVTRLARPFISPEDALFGCCPMLTALDALGRAHHHLLFDSRYAVPCNNPEYESWFAPHRRDLVRGFHRAAVLVKTSAGVLQSRRLLRADTEDPLVRVFDNYEAALTFLSARTEAGV